MKTGRKYRCYPTKQQEQILRQWIGCQRFIYNAKVQEDWYFRSFARKSVGLAGTPAPVDQKYSHFKTAETDWLKTVPAQVLRNGATRWMQGMSRYRQGLAGRPKIRKKHGRQTVWLTKELFQMEELGDGNYALLIGARKFPFGKLRYTRHSDHGIPVSITIAHEGGAWYLSFNFEDDRVEYSTNEVADWLRSFSDEELLEATAGIDRGVAVPCATQDQNYGFSEIQAERLNTYDRKRRRWQRKAAKRVRGSKRQIKAQKRAAVYARKSANIRKDFAHQTSRKLVNDPRHKLLVFEDLKVKNMTKTAKGTIENPGRNIRQKTGLNRSMLASAWGMTVTFAAYKALQEHKLCIKVAPSYSSQECAACGHTEQANRISQSEFCCHACGNMDNADTNAAKVIAKRGVAAIQDGWTEKAKKRVKFMGPLGDTGTPSPQGVKRPGSECKTLRSMTTVPSAKNRETPTTVALAA